MRPNTVFTPRSAFIISLLAILLVPISAIAQVDTGAIRGTVTDPSGAVVPNVTVTIQDVDKNIEKTVVTNESGVYDVSATDQHLWPTYWTIRGARICSGRHSSGSICAGSDTSGGGSDPL